jgi:hypothetical protein
VNISYILARATGIPQGLNSMINSFRHTLFVFTILCSASACASEKLRFIGDVNFATKEKFQETELGGLSGIAYDQKENKLMAISDDRSQINPARFYKFDFTLNENQFTVTPSSVTKLKDKEGTFYKEKYTDFEGITLFGNDLLISSENGLDGAEVVLPGLYRFSLAGDFQELLPVPKKFLPTEDGLSGTRHNKGFETLAATPDMKTFFTANEDALAQDGPVGSPEYNSIVRIMRFREMKPEKEFAYRLEKMKSPPEGLEEDGDTGLVDMAVIDENNFYTMERSYLTSTGTNIILIFKNEISTDTTDVSEVAALENQTLQPIKKTLVANLDDFIPLMNKDFAYLDNIEGITLGPVLPNGNLSLILVSDNNFNSNQRTLFIAFEILK